MVCDAEQPAAAFLRRDEHRHLNMLYFLEDNPVQGLQRLGNTIILRGESDHRWVYISCPGEAELAAALPALTPEDRFFAAAEDWMLPLLARDREIVWRLSVLRMILPDSAAVFPPPGFEIKPLCEEEAVYIHAHSMYQDVTSSAYIRERIRSGLSAGIRVDGKLAAWAMTHDDGAIGCLHVLEDYRGRGYAYAVTAELIGLVRRQGRIPFVQIEETNRPSLNLAAKVGFARDRRLHWFEVCLEQ